MLQLIRDLLRNRSFWGILGLINLIGLAAQPLLILLTALGVLALYAILGLGNFLQSRAFRKLLKWLGIFCCWCLTGGIVGAFVQAAGIPFQSSLGLFLTISVNLALWFLPGILARRWERHRKEREYKKYQVQSEKAEQKRASAQKRRADARTRCELYYNLHAPELSKRFTHGQFTDYWNRHFGDEHPPEYVEERSRQLLDIMQKHLEKAGHTEQKKSLADIAQWFLEEKTKIDALPLNPEDKEQMIADLEARFTQLQQKYIRSMNP
jgi:hypothetical protein